MNGTRFDPKAWWLVALLLTLSPACKRADEATAVPEPEAVPVATETAAAEEGPQLAGPPVAERPTQPREEEAEASEAPEASQPAGDVAGDDDDEDEDDKDYWDKISFNHDNFDEVREYVKTYYIEADINESRAFVESANFALGAMKEPHEILPEKFYKARKDNPDEEGKLKGQVYKIAPTDPYVIHVIPKDTDDEKKKHQKRLSDDEIRALRAKVQERRALLEAEWKAIPFDEKSFTAVMKHIEGAIKKEKDPSMKKHYVAAAQGFLYSLDPHSSMVSAEAWDESTKSTTDSSFEGIGAILTQRDEMTIVESPLEGHPAHLAGVRAGDVILKVDGKDIGGLPLHKVVKRIRGPKGQAVVLTVRREGEPDEKQFSIVRAHIDIKNVSGRLIPQHKDLGYLKLTGFVPTSTSELEKWYDEISKQTSGGKLRGLVFDLRNNSGGLLQQGVKVADKFLRDGVIVSVKNRVKSDEVYRAHDADTWDVPLIVLVNDGAASASEIVASALQDNGRGLVVGERSFGKASVQTLFSPLLRKDYYIKLTIARYYSPSGRTIQVVGVSPDLEVPPDVDGKMPLGFREENLSHYLTPIASDIKSPNEALAKRVKECADQRGIAEKIHAADPHPQVKYDYQLMKSADYLECLIDLQAEAHK